MKFLIFLALSISFQVLAQTQTRTIPDAHAFKQWQPVDGYADGSIDLSKLKSVAFNCTSDENLYPLTPQQYTKHYHIFDWGSYDHFKLTADSEACLVGSKYKNSQGVKACLSPDTVYYVLMSDVYRDRCGKMYRAFWEVIYLKKNDNMGTLFSKGRTMYPKNGSTHDFYEGHTYALHRNQFVMLTEIFNQDAEKISLSQQRAVKTHKFDASTIIYTPLNQ